LVLKPYLILWFDQRARPATESFWRRREAQKAAMERAGILLRFGRIVLNVDWLSERHVRILEQRSDLAHDTRAGLPNE
jgi:hypothetical protein